MYTLTFLFAVSAPMHNPPTPPWPRSSNIGWQAKPTKLPSRAVQRLRRFQTMRKSSRSAPGATTPPSGARTVSFASSNAPGPTKSTMPNSGIPKFERLSVSTRLRHAPCFTLLRRTEWVLAGASTADMLDRTRAEVAAKKITEPEIGAMCYMMSKNGYLGDANGHWHPHLMFFLPHTESAAWGANLPGVPILVAAAASTPSPYS